MKLVDFFLIFLFFFPSLIHHADRQLKQDDEVPMVQVKEQGQSVLVLKKVASCGPAPTTGSADSESDARWESPQPRHALGFLPGTLLPFPAPSHSLALLLPALLSLPPLPLSLRLSSVLADCRALSSQMDLVPCERTRKARSFSL